MNIEFDHRDEVVVSAQQKNKWRDAVSAACSGSLTVKQTEFFERGRCEILCLIDGQNGDSSVRAPEFEQLMQIVGTADGCCQSIESAQTSYHVGSGQRRVTEADDAVL